MCDKCPETSYGTAYSKSESVTVKIEAFCSKCSKPIEKETQIHFGGEFWEPHISCSCGWGIYLGVHFGGMNKAKIDPRG